MRNPSMGSTPAVHSQRKIFSMGNQRLTPTKIASISGDFEASTENVI